MLCICYRDGFTDVMGSVMCWGVVRLCFWVGVFVYRWEYLGVGNYIRRWVSVVCESSVSSVRVGWGGESILVKCV